jgi:hypothetical protein
VLTVSNAYLAYVGILGTDDAGFAFFLVATLAALDRALDTRRGRHFLVAGNPGGLTLLQKAGGSWLPASCSPCRSFRPARGCAPSCSCGPLSWRRSGPISSAIYLAHGSIGFRISPLDWHLRAEGYEGMMRLFAEPTRADRDALRIRSGARRRARRARAREARRRAAAGTAVALFSQSVLHARDTRVPAALGLAAVRSCAVVRRPGGADGAGAPRCNAAARSAVARRAAFFSPSSCPYGAVACGAACHRDARLGRGRRRPTPLRWRWRSPSWPGRLGPRRCAANARRGAGPEPLSRGSRMARRAHPAEDRILTFDPWFASWLTRRDAIMIPSGGRHRAGHRRTTVRRSLAVAGTCSRDRTRAGLSAARRRADGNRRRARVRGRDLPRLQARLVRAPEVLLSGGEAWSPRVPRSSWGSASRTGGRTVARSPRALEQPVRLRPDGRPTSAASSAWRRSGGASTS